MLVLTKKFNFMVMEGSCAKGAGLQCPRRTIQLEKLDK